MEAKENMTRLVDVPSKVREVVMDTIGYKVPDAQPLISAGLIDSLSLLRLICNLENQLGITIPDESVSPDDFECMERILETIARLTSRSDRVAESAGAPRQQSASGKNSE